MTVRTKRVFYVEYLAHPSFAEVIASRPDVQLERIANNATEPEAAPFLAAAHAYQIVSARDELAPAFFADAALLRRTPNLLVVSTHGAGFDTVNPDACTAAGVLVVNQAGGNAEAVAEHALGLLLCLTKRTIESDRRMRRGSGIDRNAYIGR